MRKVKFQSLDGVLYICMCVSRTEIKRPWRNIYPAYLVVTNSLVYLEATCHMTSPNDVTCGLVLTSICPGAIVLTQRRLLLPWSKATCFVVRGMCVRGALRVLLYQPCHVGWWGGLARLGRRFSAHECPASVWLETPGNPSKCGASYAGGSAIYTPYKYFKYIYIYITVSSTSTLKYIYLRIYCIPQFLGVINA